MNCLLCNHERVHRSRPQRTWNASAGFTLIELMVAIGVTMILLLLANQLFFSTTKAIGQGTAVAEKIDGARAVSERMQKDFATMLGPHGGEVYGPTPDDSAGGVLIIANYLIPDVELAKPHGPDSPDEFRPSPTSDVVFRPVRSDQLVFLRAVNGELPLAPGSRDSFSAWNEAGLAKVQKVFYGHVKRTNPDGTFPNEELGADGADRRATDWILGRQALFLGEQLIDGSDLRLPPHHATWAAFDSSLVNVESGAPNALYMATTDYAYFSFSDRTHPNGALVSYDDQFVWGPQFTLGANLDRNTYHDKATYRYTYLPRTTSGSWTAKRRLHVNPSPEGWKSWQVAQSHPFLMEHVSDFIVEFAADIYTGDTTTASPNPDGQVDYDRDVPARNYVGGNIRWYGFWINDPEENIYRYMDASGNVQEEAFDPNLPVVYKIPDTWGPNRGDGTFVFRHDDKNSKAIPGYHPVDPDQTSNWPYLLRIRFRVHDKRGELKQGNNQHGMWFEQIVRVPRP